MFLHANFLFMIFIFSLVNGKNIVEILNNVENSPNYDSNEKNSDVIPKWKQKELEGVSVIKT